MEKVCGNLKAGIFLLSLLGVMMPLYYKIFRGYEELVIEIEVLSFNSLIFRFPVVFD